MTSFQQTSNIIQIIVPNVGQKKHCKKVKIARVMYNLNTAVTSQLLTANLRCT